MAPSAPLHSVIQPQPLQSPIRKSADDEKYEEERLVFNKTIGGHYRHGKTGYRRVGALCLTWKDDDMQCKSTEVDSFKGLLENEFKFETDYYEIPSERWQTALQKKLADFVHEYDSPDCLAIVYYGGHGYDGIETKKFKLSAKVKPDGDGDPSVFFENILHCLQLPSCDQLLIIDCCCAAKAYTHDYIGGKRKFELLTSAAANEKCPAPSLPGSFTKLLNERLRHLVHNRANGFSTSQLFSELYHNAKEIKPHYFNQSRHNYGNIWLRPQVANTMPVSEGDSTYLHFTLRLNEELDPAIMNEIATSLQYVPHVNQARIDHVYAPKRQLDNFMGSVLRAKKLRPLVKNLQERRAAKKVEALKHGDHRDPPSPTLVKLLLKQKQNPVFDWSHTEIFQVSTKRSGTWPPSHVDKPSRIKSSSRRSSFVKSRVDVPDPGALPVPSSSPRSIKSTNLSLPGDKVHRSLSSISISLQQSMSIVEAYSPVSPHRFRRYIYPDGMLPVVVWCSALSALILFLLNQKDYIQLGCAIFRSRRCEGY